MAAHGPVFHIPHAQGRSTFPRSNYLRVSVKLCPGSSPHACPGLCSLVPRDHPYALTEPLSLSPPAGQGPCQVEDGPGLRISAVSTFWPPHHPCILLPRLEALHPPSLCFSCQFFARSSVPNSLPGWLIITLQISVQMSPPSSPAQLRSLSQ